MISTEFRLGQRLDNLDLASSPGFIAFKKAMVTPLGQLQQLDGTTIEVQLEIEGEVRSIRGRGVYATGDSDFGPVLKILVSDQCGDFELLIAESTWTGCFESSELPGCDYRISLVLPPSEMRLAPR